MAGSFNHVITNSGNLRSPEMMDRMLENGGDVFEAIEEMYGMIWWLAKHHTDPALYVETARQKYKEGLAFAQATPNKGKYNGR